MLMIAYKSINWEFNQFKKNIKQQCVLCSSENNWYNRGRKEEEVFEL